MKPSGLQIFFNETEVIIRKLARQEFDRACGELIILSLPCNATLLGETVLAEAKKEVSLDAESRKASEIRNYLKFTSKHHLIDVHFAGQ